jgi:hypothetical protein
MPPRTRLLSLIAAALAAVLPARAANPDGSTAEAGNAEAARLYSEANAYVTNMAEGAYSYAYLQFYWKRAQANVDRIRRVYADSPTARSLARGELKLGPFELDYFKTRILYNLELKQLGSFDDVNCSIFLYGLDENRSDELRNEALADILEVLARRQRWGEALRFPVLDAHRPILLGSIFRVAAFYDQPQIIEQMSHRASAAEKAAAGFDAITAEALALLGKPRADLLKFVDSHPTDAVRTAALRGIVDRAILIHRMETHHLPPGEAIQTVHTVVQNLSLRDDVQASAAAIFKGRPGDAAPLLAVYAASRGISPDAGAPLGAHLAYMQYLSDSGRLSEAAGYARRAGLSGGGLRECELKAIELNAEAGQEGDAERLRLAFAAGGPRDANLAALAEFRGRMDSAEVPLVARTKTFAELPITEPCVMAVAIMDWSLTPNRSQRGATPWDAVVFKFAGGFKNLPKAKSAAVGDAASTVKPY